MPTTQTIETVAAAMPDVSSARIAAQVNSRWDSLTKPRGSLGALETSVVKLACIQGTAVPKLERLAVYVFCGDHGVTVEGVSPYPSVVTREMVANFLRGGAAINVLARRIGAETRIVNAGVAGAKIEGAIDLRVAEGTKNFAREAAMTRKQAELALVRGMDLGAAAASGFDLVCVGEMGIGNTTSASALLCAFTGLEPHAAVGRGAGLDDRGLARKREVVTEALRLHADRFGDPLDLTAALGGFEIVMMAGFLLGAAKARLPVVIDGFIGGAAFLVARAFYPGIGAHVFWGHRSAEAGHGRLIEEAGGEPLLDFGMRLGEGTGAVLAAQLLVGALELYRRMATFAEASVSDKEG